MGQADTSLEVELPTFSIVLETENLANADLKGLAKSLVSLNQQDISPCQAQEVLLIDSGDAPTTLLTQLRRQYPWLKVYQVPLGTGYYKAKMLGAQLATGEVVVYFDSDCIYESHWLRQILTPFNQGDNIQIIAGETKTRGQGIYGTAMAFSYIFPPYSQEQKLTATSQYFLNNVAFRREFLLHNPMPIDLPLYRGNCVIHAHQLRSQNYIIWRQPLARATHAPPNGFMHFYWRFLLIGHDLYWQHKLLATHQVKISQKDSSGVGEIEVLKERMSKTFSQDPYRILHMPLAIPIIITSLILILIGYIITAVKPSYLLKSYA